MNIVSVLITRCSLLNNNNVFSAVNIPLNTRNMVIIASTKVPVNSPFLGNFGEYSRELWGIFPAKINSREFYNPDTYTYILHIHTYSRDTIYVLAMSEMNA